MARPPVKGAMGLRVERCSHLERCLLDTQSRFLAEPDPPPRQSGKGLQLSDFSTTTLLLTHFGEILLSRGQFALPSTSTSRGIEKRDDPDLD